MILVLGAITQLALCVYLLETRWTQDSIIDSDERPNGTLVLCPCPGVDLARLVCKKCSLASIQGSALKESGSGFSSPWAMVISPKVAVSEDPVFSCQHGLI